MASVRGPILAKSVSLFSVIPHLTDATASRLSANLQGILWMLMAGSAFAAANVTVRLATHDLHPFVVVFFRSAIAVLLMAHVFLGPRFYWAPSPVMRLHLLRGILQATALLCLYAAIAISPLATVIAISFITPLVSGAGAIALMGEPSRWNRWLAIFLGFAGVLIVIRPGLIAVSLGVFLVLGYAVQQAASNLAGKVLARSEPALVVVAWMTLLSTPLALVPALFVWSWPDLVTLGYLAVNALLSTFAHFATVRAYRVVDITIADPMMFFRMIAAAFFGYWFFNEVPDIWTWVGSAVIAAAGTLLSRDRS